MLEREDDTNRTRFHFSLTVFETRIFQGLVFPTINIVFRPTKLKVDIQLRLINAETTTYKYSN